MSAITQRIMQGGQLQVALEVCLVSKHQKRHKKQQLQEIKKANPDAMLGLVKRT